MKQLAIAIFFGTMAVIGWELGNLFTDPKPQPRDYQIEIKGNKALVYDGQTFKGSVILSGQLDSLITKDNQ